MPVIPVLVSLLTAPALSLFLLAGNQTVALVALGVGSFLMPAYQAAAVTVIHAVAHPRMRALAVTIVFSGVAIGGLGLGPLVVGSLSDLLTSAYGPSALRYALLVPALIPLLTAFSFWRAAAP